MKKIWTRKPHKRKPTEPHLRHMFESHRNQCICANQYTGCYIIGILALDEIRLWFRVANKTFTKLDPVNQE